MKTDEDMERREAAIKEIEILGHEAVCFEKLPGRPLPDDKDTKDKCLEMVNESDLLIAIVDDTLTEIMEAEIEEAYKQLGSTRIFLYFTKGTKRDHKAKGLWDSSKNSNILKEFESPDDLKLVIARSIASYLKDAFAKPSKKSSVLLSTKIALQSCNEWSRRFSLSKGDTITITCLANQPFYAGFHSREEFVRRRGAAWHSGFEFGNLNQKKGYTKKMKIKDDDDYYFILRATWLPIILMSYGVAVEIKRVPYQP